MEMEIGIEMDNRAGWIAIVVIGDGDGWWWCRLRYINRSRKVLRNKSNNTARSLRMSRRL